MTLPYHKRANLLRRSDENEPQNARRRPHDELIGLYGGFSAQLARSRRRAKSVRRAGAAPRRSRRMH